MYKILSLTNSVIDITQLTNKEQEFFYFTLNHLDELFNVTLQEFGKQYGCGMSFIYNFFKKINVIGIKDYIYKLGIIRGLQKAKEEDDDTNHEKETSSVSLLNSILKKYQLNSYVNKYLLMNQKDEIYKLCSYIKNARRIIAYAHKFIDNTLSELFQQFKKLNVSCAVIYPNDSEDNKGILSKLNGRDLFIFYIHNKTSNNVINQLKKVKNYCPNSKIAIISATSAQEEFASYPDILINLNCDNHQINYDKKNLTLWPYQCFIYLNDYIINLIQQDNLNEIKKDY